MRALWIMLWVSVWNEGAIVIIVSLLGLQLEHFCLLGEDTMRIILRAGYLGCCFMPPSPNLRQPHHHHSPMGKIDRRAPMTLPSQ